LVINDRIHISNKARVWVFFAVPIAVQVAVFTVSWLMLQDKRPQIEVLSGRSEACDHQGQAATAVYDPAKSDQPRIVVLSVYGSIHTFTSEADPELRLTSIDQAQLEVCLWEIGRSITDTCKLPSSHFQWKKREIRTS